jgi:hypothetical protein
MYGSQSYGATGYGWQAETVSSNIVSFGERVFSLLRAGLIQPIFVNQNDYGFDLGPWTLLDGEGDPQNLLGASLSLNVQDSQDASGALLFSGAIAVDNVATGIVHYSVENGNFSSPGVFLAQIVANFGSEQVSWPAFQIKVLPSLPRYNN